MKYGVCVIWGTWYQLEYTVYPMKYEVCVIWGTWYKLDYKVCPMKYAQGFLGQSQHHKDCICDLKQDCSISIADTLKLLQSCPKPLILCSIYTTSQSLLTRGWEVHEWYIGYFVVANLSSHGYSAVSVLIDTGANKLCDWRNEWYVTCDP